MLINQPVSQPRWWLSSPRCWLEMNKFRLSSILGYRTIYDPTFWLSSPRCLSAARFLFQHISGNSPAGPKKMKLCDMPDETFPNTPSAPPCPSPSSEDWFMMPSRWRSRGPDTRTDRRLGSISSAQLSSGRRDRARLLQGLLSHTPKSHTRKIEKWLISPSWTSDSDNGTKPDEWWHNRHTQDLQTVISVTRTHAHWQACHGHTQRQEMWGDVATCAEIRIQSWCDQDIMPLS